MLSDSCYKDYLHRDDDDREQTHLSVFRPMTKTRSGIHSLLTNTNKCKPKVDLVEFESFKGKYKN